MDWEFLWFLVIVAATVAITPFVLIYWDNFGKKQGQKMFGRLKTM